MQKQTYLKQSLKLALSRTPLPPSPTPAISLKLLLNTNLHECAFNMLLLPISFSCRFIRDSSEKSNVKRLCWQKQKTFIQEQYLHCTRRGGLSLNFIPSNNIKVNFDHMWVNRILRKVEVHLQLDGSFADDEAALDFR